ncbi:response regulator [Gracilibacillus sp. S3-1-1]|uniref:Response regulator n=1 Tax=Gracilibacillus pellucidus TaxID=3095368 RepID=A0ACC6M167_9BACI|nr:response regulator [Gracilibacillus sp. S3-1-1]MDX8044691.1 response regulator [Gracilibacillus sp. S3-1-1]
MYKVLLVDDERIILDGISAIINWKEHEAELIGKALNGLEAYEFIQQQQPDIVITDITMPGLNGIELVKKASEIYPTVKWIFLSGFDEFEYARQAMRFGVKHYLLKPCNEEHIAEALDDVIIEKRSEDETRQYMQAMEATKVIQNEEVLKQFFTYKQLSEITQSNMLKLLDELFQDDPFFFWLVNMEVTIDSQTICQLFADDGCVATIGNNQLLVALRYSNDHLVKLHHFCNVHEQKIMSVTTRSFIKDQLMAIPTINEMKQQLFYSSCNSLITFHDWVSFTDLFPMKSEIEVDTIVLLLKKKRKKQAITHISDYMQVLATHHVAPKVTRGYFIHFYLLLMTKLTDHSTESSIETIGKMEEFHYASDFVQFFVDLFERILSQNERSVEYSKVVNEMLVCIEEEVENPNLSLQWLANHYLYMNADYLGKIFKKEIGQRFSAYVTNVRINKAVKMIETEKDMKVFELAERLGFGNNPQYFSQIFKKMKGVSPSEMLKSYEEKVE